MDGIDDSFWTGETIWFYVSLVLGAILIFQAGVWYAQHTSTTASPAQTRAQQSDPEPTTTGSTSSNAESASLPEVPEWTRDLPRPSENKTLGDSDAPVTITEYVDIECPFCRRYIRRTFPDVREEYIEPGKVYYQVRHFPLPMHERAVPAGNAAECAADQGDFWPFKHVLMNTDRSLTNETFVDVARHVGVEDLEAFRTCVESMQHEETVRAEHSAAKKQGVSATPTLFVEDEKLEGAQPFEKVRELIEGELSS